MNVNCPKTPEHLKWWKIRIFGETDGIGCSGTKDLVHIHSLEAMIFKRRADLEPCRMQLAKIAQTYFR